MRLHEHLRAPLLIYEDGKPRNTESADAIEERCHVNVWKLEAALRSGRPILVD